MLETKDGLSMRYGAFAALNGVRFRISRGEIVGLLGPNGAGKSTLLKIITGYLYPSQGTVYIAGKDVRHDPGTRALVGYLPEQLPLYPDMEVREYLRFAGNARGLPRAKLDSRLDWVKEKCGLTPVYASVIHTLSKGYRQRTALAQALIHDPEIVILDEPTSGLDPHQVLEVRTLIRELKERQKTILFSTHILQEVEAVAERLIILHLGRIIADGTIPELKAMVAGHMVCEVALAPGVSPEEARNGIRGLKEVAEAGEVGEMRYAVHGRAGADIRPALAELIREKGWDFRELRPLPVSLERVFLDLTEKSGGKTP